MGDSSPLADPNPNPRTCLVQSGDRPHRIKGVWRKRRCWSTAACHSLGEATAYRTFSLTPGGESAR
jgi:hypothetical protein